MKKFSLISLSLMVAALMTIGGCTKETVQTDKADGAILQENNIPDGRKTITYTVSVVSANGCQSGRVSGVTGARVTLVQNGREFRSPATTAAGVAVFTGLAAGTVTGYVEAPNYIGLNFNALLTTTADQSDLDIVEFAGSTIAIFERNCSVQGRAVGDWDLSPTTPNTFNANITPPAGGGTILPPVPEPRFKLDFTFNQQNYLTAVNGPAIAGSPVRSGQVTAVAFDHLSYFATFSDPQLGRFQFSNVPSLSSTYGLTAAAVGFVPLNVTWGTVSSPQNRVLTAMNAAFVNAQLTPAIFTPCSNISLINITIQ